MKNTRIIWGLYLSCILSIFLCCNNKPVYNANPDIESIIVSDKTSEKDLIWTDLKQYEVKKETTICASENEISFSNISIVSNSTAAIKGVSVIGPRATYKQYAQKIGANYLDVTDANWSWIENEIFLAGIVQRGDDVIFAGRFDSLLLDPKSTLAREIKYLENNGYKWTKNYSKMIKK